MNEVFEFRRKLNIHKIILFVVITLFLLIISIELITNLFKKDNNKTSQNTTSIFHDNSKLTSLTLPSTYNLEQYNSNGNYLIELRSNQNLNILISNKDIISSKKLSDIIFADRSSFLKNFESPSEVSEISNIAINGEYEAFTYNFNYIISNHKFNLQTIWIEAQNKYFVIDIAMPLNEKHLYSNLIQEITSSFTINNNTN